MDANVLNGRLVTLNTKTLCGNLKKSNLLCGKT